MLEDSKYRDYPPDRSAPDADELDEATLDRVVGGLQSPQQSNGFQKGNDLPYISQPNQAQNGARGLLPGR